MTIFGGFREGKLQPAEAKSTDVVVGVTWAEPDVAAVIAMVDDLMAEWRGQSLLDQVRVMDALLDIRNELTKGDE